MIAALRNTATWVSATRRRVRARLGTGDGGFALLESLVAITIITIITAALGTYFVSSMASSKLQRNREIATHIADGALDTLRSYPATDLLSGRGATAVASQYSAAPTAIKSSWLNSMDWASAYDSSASPSAGATATVPTSSFTKSPDNRTTFTVNEYLGYCGMPKRATNVNCDTSYYKTANSVTYLRGVVTVSWPDPTCASSTCYYTTATLITPDSDPTFNLNQTGQPTPVVSNPGNQDNQIGDTVSLQLGVQSGTGVPSFSWTITSGGLPAGLSLSTSGLISGSPTTAVTSKSVTVTVTDSFGRTANSTFSWTVVPKLVASSVANQFSTTGTAITNFTITASGGAGGPYAFTSSSLPPGITIGSSTGTVSGTPTSTGTYPVTVTVKDSTTHTTTVTWTWTVYAPIVVTNPGTQANVVSTAITPLQIAASGGSGSYTWSVGGSVPTGLTFSGGQFTGTPTTKGAYSVTVFVTDTVLNTTKSVSFTWNIVAPVVITGGSNQVANSGTSTTAVTLSATGGDTGSGATYAWTDPNGTLPPGMSVSTDASYRGVISGTPTAAGTYNVQLKITASTGLVSWYGFTWTVYPALVVTNPGNQQSTVNTSITALPIAGSGGSGNFTWSASGLPAGLSMSSSGVISGTPTATGTSTVTITLTDTTTTYTKTSSFSWFVAPKPTVTAPANQFTTTTGAVGSGVQAGGSCLNTPCTYTINNGPAGLSISSTGVITGTITSTPQTFTNVTITVKDAANQSATSGTFTWTVNAKPTISTPANQTTYVNRAATNVTVTASSGTTAYTYSASGLPAGLSINSGTGVISGTAGSSTSSNSVTVTVTDASGVTATTSTFKWYVTDLILAVPDQQIGTSSALSVPLDNFEVGGTGANTYVVTGMPGWMSYSSATKTITGTSPSSESATTLTVTATDAAGAFVTDTLTVYVSKTRFLFGDQQASLNSAVSVTLDTYVSGTSFSSFTVTGLPAWLTYNTSTHVISGTAPAANTVASGISIKVTETTGFTFTRTIKWIASDLRWNGTSTTWSTTHGVAMSKNLSTFFTGGTGAYTYQTASSLPTGTSLNFGTGVVSGTPTTISTKTVVFTVTDNVGATASITVTWNVT